MQVAVAQIVCVPGELEKNLGTIGNSAEQAKAAGAELVVFPESADTGHDLVTLLVAARRRGQRPMTALRNVRKPLPPAPITECTGPRRVQA